MKLSLDIWVEQFDLATRNSFPIKEVSVEEYDPHWGDKLAYDWRQKPTRPVDKHKDMIYIIPVAKANDEEKRALWLKGIIYSDEIPDGLTVQDFGKEK